MNKIIIFDTTLRDGEQAPGASLTSEEKLEVALQLQKLGVDVIEAGFPIASPDELQAVKSVGRHIKGSVVCGLARCLEKDILAVKNALSGARQPRIHIFLATSKIHLKYKFKKAEDEILEIARASTVMARRYFDDIEFSPEDATRSERSFLFKVIETAISSGARTINIPDTVGYSYPQEIHSLITDILNNVPNINKAVISIHCHDDLGLATANSLSAVLAGARQVHCTINGIGERAGNASLEEVIMAIKVRRDAFKNLDAQVNTKEIYRTSHLVSSLTGLIVPVNKAIVGGNAFRHESGIHQDAIMKKRITYEIMNPKDVGMASTQLVLGKHSGSHALAKRLKDLGFKLDENKIRVIFAKFKELTDKKKEIFDDDIAALAQAQMREKKQIYELEAIKVITGTNIVPEGFVSIKYKHQTFQAHSTGDGPVDACYKAVDKITKIKAKLLSYKLEAITKGKDAQGLVRVEIHVRGKNSIGRGSSTDILEASVRAYLDALNKAL
ncbi:MAG: 2-isopropylmalate synthase [Candidatus Omnitrophica bacterium]|nr:2-isopropylmalate synthase [Candidatus Omnitrophota bacterium]